jgi:hypothetical protein
MSEVPHIQELREQAVDFIKRNWLSETKAPDITTADLTVLYMAAFAHEVLKLRDAGIDWRKP